MNELLPFDSDLHEDLFNLIILASNDRHYSHVMSVEVLSHMVIRWYPFQFNDRSLAPVEYEAYVQSAIFPMLASGMYPKISAYENAIYENKMIFRFED